MDLEFAVSQKEYVSANYLNLLPKGFFLCLFLMLGGVVGATFDWIKNGGHPSWILPLGQLAVLLTALFYFSIPILARTTYRQRGLHIPVHCKLGETGIIFSMEGSQTEIPWSKFCKWKENGEIFLVCESVIAFRVFPKRAFRSQEDILSFRKIITSHIGRAT